jgi:hypothetical protein
MTDALPHHMIDPMTGPVTMADIFQSSRLSCRLAMSFFVTQPVPTHDIHKMMRIGEKIYVPPFRAHFS